MRPVNMVFDHKTGKWVNSDDSKGGGSYRVTTWWRTFEDFENWTKSAAFAEAHANRAPKEMFSGPSRLEMHEVFLSTNLPPPRPSSLPKLQNSQTGSSPSAAAAASAIEKKKNGTTNPNARMYDALPMINLEELARYRNGSKVYVGLCGLVYDVSSSKDLYGEGGNYHVFAGRDATRALAYGVLEEAKVLERPGDQSDMGTNQFMALDDWIEQFEEKYPVIARLNTVQKNSKL